MKKTNESNAEGAMGSDGYGSELEGIKGKGMGSGPNASKDHKRRTKEERLRELLELDGGATPTLAETRCAEDVVEAERELAGAGPRMKHIAEENLEVAVVCLTEELQKRKDSGEIKKGEDETGADNELFSQKLDGVL